MSAIPDSLQYILLMAGCLLLTLPLEFLFNARVYRRPLRLLQAVLITVLVFSIWDTIAIHAELWSYSERFTSGIVLPFGLPFEELLFFIAIPICGLLTYEAVGRVLTFGQSFTRRARSKKQEVDDA